MKIVCCAVAAVLSCLPVFAQAPTNATAADPFRSHVRSTLRCSRSSFVRWPEYVRSNCSALGPAARSIYVSRQMGVPRSLSRR